MTSVVTRARAIDVNRAVGVITLAFATDPACRWLYPDAHEYMKYFPPFVRAFGGRAFETGTAYVTENYEGAALWLPPGEHADDEALGAIIEESVPEERQDLLFNLVEMQALSHTAEPHWYLPLIGVDPAHQRKGLGSKLLDEALRVCDEQGLHAYLEATTRESRALYQRHGFEVTQELQVGDIPPMWPMVRRPRS